MLNILYDIYQNIQIKTAKAMAENALSATKDELFRIDELERKVELLLMTTEALWSIIKKSQNLSDNELIELIKQIDMKDGKLDGRVEKSAPRKCPKCAKTIQIRSSSCIYCGHRIESLPFAR